MISIDEFKAWAEYAKEHKIKHLKTADFEFEFDARAYPEPMEEPAFKLPDEQKTEENKQNEELLFWSA